MHTRDSDPITLPRSSGIDLEGASWRSGSEGCRRERSSKRVLMWVVKCGRLLEFELIQEKGATLVGGCVCVRLVFNGMLLALINFHQFQSMGVRLDVTIPCTVITCYMMVLGSRIVIGFVGNVFAAFSCIFLHV